jgi:hypothetical protein
MEDGELFVMKLLWKLDEIRQATGTRMALPHVTRVLARNYGAKPELGSIDFNYRNRQPCNPLLEPRTRTVIVGFFQQASAFIGRGRELSTSN